MSLSVWIGIFMTRMVTKQDFENIFCTKFENLNCAVTFALRNTEKGA